ncbi:hypothetical protein N7478_010518 [Penicillium angulare]|uniref:uncharacterized protein n=1 Tax=Penicillium angulare TaxID=116970 RepID=UPI0025408218|nr:uncharacterized protein N7478_010518 [Penicillium angulare]KAJ5267710.1 hypothetical protein N7478_010518 [Penicillium angulare]
MASDSDELTAEEIIVPESLLVSALIGSAWPQDVRVSPSPYYHASNKAGDIHPQKKRQSRTSCQISHLLALEEGRETPFSIHANVEQDIAPPSSDDSNNTSIRLHWRKTIQYSQLGEVHDDSLDRATGELPKHSNVFHKRVAHTSE